MARTMPAERVLGCRASLIGPVHRCGKLSAASEENHLETPGKIGPAMRALFMPKASAREFHQSNGPTARQYPPGAPETLTGSASQEGIRRLLRSQPRRLGFGQPARRDPGELCEHTMRVTDWPHKPELSTWLETGTFYLAPTTSLSP